MDPVIIGSLGVIVLMVGLIFYVLKPAQTPQAPTKSQEAKQREIIDGYKARLDETLDGLSGDTLEEAKRRELTAISQELSRNLFFDHDEMREAVAELARHMPGRSG